MIKAKSMLNCIVKEGEDSDKAPTMRAAIAIVMLLLLSSFNGCIGFMTQKQEGRVYSSSKQIDAKVRQSMVDDNRIQWGSSQPTSTVMYSRVNDSEDVFLLSIDGTLASSTRQRSYMAVSIALNVWPSCNLQYMN